MKGSFSDANLPAIGKSHFSRGQYNNENAYSQEFNSGVEKQNSGIFFDAPLASKMGSNTTNLKEFLDCP